MVSGDYSSSWSESRNGPEDFGRSFSAKTNKRGITKERPNAMDCKRLDIHFVKFLSREHFVYHVLSHVSDEVKHNFPFSFM